MLAAEMAEEIDNVATKTSFFIRLMVGLCSLLAANAAFGATLPACSTMAGSNEICGVITGLLTVTSGPDPLELSGSIITAITGLENTALTGYSSGWSVLGAPVNPGAGPANYNNVPLVLTTNQSLLTLYCSPNASVTLTAQPTGDSLVTSCSLDLIGGISTSSTFTATINFAGGTLPQAIPLPFGQLAIGPGSSASYVCNDSAIPACASSGGASTTLSITNGTISSTCEGCTTMGVTPPVSTGLTFTMTQGGTVPSPQTVTVEDSNPPAVVSFAATASVASPAGGTWLSIVAPPGGAIGGTPSSVSVSVTPGSLGPGTYTGSVTFYAPAHNNPVTEPVKFIINPQATPPTITTTSVPGGDIGVSYSAQLAATGGTPPYTWAVTSGSLPGGLTLTASGASAGLISGTPNATGTFNFSVTAKDSANNSSAAQPLSIVIAGTPSITTSSLPAGDVEVAYSQQLAATGGTTPYTWTLSTGTLPGGLSLSSSGLISGNPTTAAISNFSVSLKDNVGGAAGPVSLSITINPSLAITTSSLPNGSVGVAYSQTLTNSGGTSPFTWSVSSGSLPGGLTLTPSTGLISGTPNTAGTSNFSVTVKDSVGGVSPAKSLSITIGAGVTITTSSLPGGEVNVAYSQTLGATGGTPPYTWSVSSGSLPAGLTLTPSGSSAGAITGSPTTAGTSSFSVTVKDSNGLMAGPQPLSITILADPTITTSSLPSGEVGVTYSQGLVVSGGTSPYTWTITSGSLPGGLTLNASSGLISGIPTTAVSALPFSVTVKDTDGIVSPVANLSITITAVTVTTTSPLPNGVAGVSYSQTLNATGGTAPYTWTLSGGVLPAGLSLNSSGAITGNPNTVGSYSFSVIAKDSLGSMSPSTPFSLTIVNPLTITTTSPLPTGVVGVSYSQNLAATGGTPPYTWTLTSGTLPTSLTLSSSGLISGTPSVSGSSSFSVSVKDSNGLTAGPQSLSVTINPALAITTTSLPNGAPGTSYNASLAATGGIPPYSNWTVSSGSLPVGLTLSSSSGAITGTPSTTGTSSFAVTVKDSANNVSQPASLSITISSGLTITTTSLPNATVGIAYNQTLGATGGVPPYSSWTVSSGSLPSGLTLNASSGQITGVATTAGPATSFSVTVKDSTNTTSPAQPLTITVVNIVTITTSSLPAGTVGVSYSQGLAATNGTPPYSSWTIASGSLPPGLTLNSGTGVISGIPSTSTGSPFAFTVTVKDSNGVNSPPASLSIALASSLTITTTSLPNGAVGTSYSQTLGAAGGTPPYTWTLSSGSLPAGLTLNPTSGAITGVPTTVGMISFSVTVKDSNSNTAGPQNLSITITPALAITTTTLPSGTVGAAYTASLAATGGTTPYTWTVTAGSLPPGLTLSAAGAIGGTPSTATGSPFGFSVTVKDSVGNTAVAPLSITIASGALTITTSSLPAGTVGVAYSETLAASGGLPPYSNWTVTTGSLPAGLSLSSSTGTISGVPSATGTSNFSVTVKDSGGNTSPAKSLSITIAAPLTITTTTLPTGTLGLAYSQTLTATGGTPPYSNWTVTSGSLPPGLTLTAATGVISGTPTTATGSPFTFSVTVSDSANSTSPAKSLSIAVSTAQLKVTPSSMILFVLANTSAPATSTVTVSESDGSAQPFTVAVGASTSNWLTAVPSSGTTPGTVTLTATPAGLIPGIYPSSLIVKSGSQTITIPAQLTVTGSNLVATPSMLSFTVTPGAALPPAQAIALTTVSGTGTVPLASVTANVGWISVTSAPSAPATLQVSVSPGLLTPGTYVGDVIVKGVGSPDASLEIPVTITVNAAPQLTVTPAALTFAYQIGGTVPAAQSFAVSSGSTVLNFIATPPGSWVQLSPTSGATPATVQVTVNPTGLAAGTYTGAIMVTAGAASVPVTVTLTVTAATQLVITPSQLTFVAPSGGAAPGPQTLTLTSTGTPLGFTAAAGSYWLSVTPTAGTTPATLTVSVNTNGLANGLYNGTINITQGGSAVPTMVLVTLGIGATPTISGVINAASGATGSVAPGMAISIFGTGLGPQTPASFALPPQDGTVATTLAGTQVWFDGTAVPILYTSSTQVNALVPFELANKLTGAAQAPTTMLQVAYNAVPSAGMTLPVVAAEPGMFTANATGKGEGAILNQDNSINSATNPAAQGSTIQMFGTGAGVTDPPSIDGALYPLPPPLGSLALTVTATVGGQPATVYWSGPAPGLVSGIFQVNVTLPSGLTSGNVPVTVTVGTATSQTVTVAVQ
jgi:uncharacterized protein (TIGR03437 family)